MIAEMVVFGISGASLLLGWKLGQRRPAASTELLCTGYNAHVVDARGKKGSQFVHRLDCSSLRDPYCSDGRCSFHCREMCKCSASNDPEFIGKKRS